MPSKYIKQIEALSNKLGKKDDLPVKKKEPIQK
jgi:hypothetical protein